MKQRLRPALSRRFRALARLPIALTGPRRSVTINRRFAFLARIELVRFLRACVLLSAVLLPGLTGCRQGDEIMRQIVTYEDREPIHLRVAIVRDGDFVWLF